MKQTHVQVRGARQNNLQNIDVDIPRDMLTVVTGVSGSGKSSLAFDVVYAEGQRRFLNSLSTFARRRIQQTRRADVDFVYGLSPVVAIEQKKGLHNPRSTIGTMTDIQDYMRLLYATVGQSHCPTCGKHIPIRSLNTITERIQTLPRNAKVSLRAPVMQIYGETYTFLIDEVRKKGYRYLWVDGERLDMSDTIELDDSRTDYTLEVEVDTFTLTREDQYKAIAHALENATKRAGDGFVRIEVETEEPADLTDFYQYIGCPQHHICMGELHPFYFSFNDSDSACRTCLGIGSHKQADMQLMIANPERSIKRGALVSSVYNNTTNWSYNDVIMYSLSQHYGYSMDTPFSELSEDVRHMLFYGSNGEKIDMVQPEDAGRKRNWITGKNFAWDGFLARFNRWYRNMLQNPKVESTEGWGIHKLLVESNCPDCHGAKLKPQRLLVEINGLNISQATELPLPELVTFLEGITFTPDKQDVGHQIVQEIRNRVTLLLDIGLYYMSLSRRSDSISGGEAQRIRLSTQISSGLMGMLYVLDEPSIGLHARDGERIINTLQKLRDLGNTVIIVEHDLETIKQADYLLEIGPGPGSQGGKVVAQGTPDDLMAQEGSIIGQYLKGTREIPLPEFRKAPGALALRIFGARQHNLQNVNVDIPLGLFTCVTGVSGSGKSTLINDILFKKLHSEFYDPRVRAGAHDRLEGIPLISTVVNIDQSPIGRNSRSNPATYVGFYDRIRTLFAAVPDALDRGYTDRDFSFNHKDTYRCEECSGEGVIVRELEFMADIETVCPVCNGSRFQKEILEIKYNGKSIADVLDMPIEEALRLFETEKYIHHKLKTLDSLGLGYLKLGQSSTTLSGGEAQRIKLATELGKLHRGTHNLYILDEPTTGLHMEDIKLLLACLLRLRDTGHSVLVIEHHLDVIKMADFVIDMGPEGGKQGGRVVVQGTPEQVAACAESHTGQYLIPLLTHEVPVVQEEESILRLPKRKSRKKAE